MKNLVFGLLFLTLVVSSWGVYSYFDRFHRARNAQAPRPKLIVYTHSSFMSPFGPGPDIAKAFSEVCLCDVSYVDAGGGQVLYEKLKLASQVDVVVGLDQVSLKDAAKQIKWRDLTPADRDWHPIFARNHYRHFLPYDFSPVTIVFRKTKAVGEAVSLQALLASLPDSSLALQDPRQSSLGLQLVYWAFVEAGSNLEKLAEIADLVKTKTFRVSPDWSAAYGLFKRGRSDYVLSYATSPVYHEKVESDSSFAAAEVGGGHPVHLEYAAVPDKCRSCGLAERFVEFLSEPNIQKIIYEKNFMLPIVNGVVDESELAGFDKFKSLNIETLDQFVDQREEILEIWNQKIK